MALLPDASIVYAARTRSKLPALRMMEAAVPARKISSLLKFSDPRHR